MGKIKYLIAAVVLGLTLLAAWTTVENRSGYYVQHETVMYPASDTSMVPRHTNPIISRRAGKGFLVVANTANYNLDADADVDLQISADGHNWSTVIADLFTSIDSSATGPHVAEFKCDSIWAPYYRLNVVPDDTLIGDPIGFSIIYEAF